MEAIRRGSGIDDPCQLVSSFLMADAGLLERVVDLMVPFRKKYLYTPEMNGSYSLEAVLPALVPDLSYSDLEIQEGGSASLTYESLYFDIDPVSIAKKREDLLKYCKLDTFSMVKILELL